MNLKRFNRYVQATRKKVRNNSIVQINIQKGLDTNIYKTNRHRGPECSQSVPKFNTLLEKHFNLMKGAYKGFSNL